MGRINAMSKQNESEVQLDRRSDDRRTDDRRTNSEPVAEDRRQGERRKVQRRRQIDPTTCERDYTGDEIEFMQALDDYKRANGRMFPTCSEILEVIRGLGYMKVSETGEVWSNTDEFVADGLDDSDDEATEESLDDIPAEEITA